MTTATTEAFISSIAYRLNRLDEQAAELRLNAIKMGVYLKTSKSPTLYQTCLDACVEAGLATTSPIATLSADIKRLTKEVIDAQ
jgi:hypothetical protein